MVFQKEHDLVSEYVSSMDLNLCFHHLVGTEDVWYLVSFKRDDVNFNGPNEEKKSIKYLTNTIFHLKVGNYLNIELKKRYHGLIKILNLLYLVKEVLLLLSIIFRLLKKCLQLHFKFLKSIHKMAPTENSLLLLTKIVSGWKFTFGQKTRLIWLKSLTFWILCLLNTKQKVTVSLKFPLIISCYLERVLFFLCEKEKKKNEHWVGFFD